MKEEHALIPKYMDHFQCIGAECEDTCCSLWQITLDKRSCENYSKISDRGMRDRLKTAMKKNEVNRSDMNYAAMILNPRTGHCPMLDDGLCAIQAKLGEHYLSQTCATYPRKVNQIGNTQEVSATPSCPEAARLILLNPNGIEFVQSEPLRRHNTQYNRKITSPSDQLTSYFWDLRITAIEILQNREFVLPHRLLLLGWLCDHISEVTKQGDFSTLSDEIAAFKSEMETNSELRDFSIFPANDEFQLKFLNKVVMERVELGVWNQRYRECLDDYIEGMKCAGEDTESIVKHYKEAYFDFYLPYFQNHEYIFENYLVNTIYHTMFPLAGKKPLFEQYLQLAIHFALIKMHLIGMSAHYKQLNDELVVKLIQSFSKNYEHNNTFVQLVCDRLKKEKYDTIGHLSLFIKNDAKIV
ncbi:flagellin lysine-N-methylase [Paenibacillus tarimensis]